MDIDSKRASSATAGRLPMTRKRLRQRGKPKKLLQEKKLQRKRKRIRRLSRGPGMRRRRNWKMTSGKFRRRSRMKTQALWLL